MSGTNPKIIDQAVKICNCEPELDELIPKFESRGTTISDFKNGKVEINGKNITLSPTVLLALTLIAYKKEDTKELSLIHI